MIRLRLVRDDSILQGDKLEILKYCQQRKLVTDVTLITDNHVYYVHKLVLASMSRTAREDFLAGGCGQSTLILTGIKPLDLENTMRLMYDAEILIPYGELPGLFKVARALGIDQFEPNESIDIPEDLIRSLPKQSQLRSSAKKSCTTFVDTGPSCPTNTPATGLIRFDHGRSRKFQSTRNSQYSPDSLFEQLSPIATTTLASTMQCSFTAESSSDSIGSPEHLRNFQDLKVNGSTAGDYCRKIQQEESFRREDEFIMDTASADISFAQEIKNSTSVWDEGTPEDTSLGLLDVAMYGSSIPTDSSCFQTTGDIVQHVENLPTDIETPSPWRGSTAGDVKEVKLSPTAHVDEESRPPTPVLNRRLRKEIIEAFPTDDHESAAEVLEAKTDAMNDRKKGVWGRLRNKRKLSMRD